MTRKGDFKKTRENVEIAEGWKRSVYNTIGIIHVFTPPVIQLETHAQMILQIILNVYFNQSKIYLLLTIS